MFARFIFEETENSEYTLLQIILRRIACELFVEDINTWYDFQFSLAPFDGDFEVISLSVIWSIVGMKTIPNP